MHADSVPAAGPPTDADLARRAGAGWLAGALRASRADTLATFGALRRARPDLAVPRRSVLNPPLWEIGHIGWFQDFWIARNPERALGVRADPAAARRPGRRADAEALYHSGQVEHGTRWALPLPDADETLDELAAQLDETLAALARTDDTGADRDDALYFFRLALLHEDMHHEAALYMAQELDVALDGRSPAPPRLPDPPPPLRVGAGRWRPGSDGEPGFAFDNELGAIERDGAPFEIDAQAVRWAEYLPFVEAGGYRDPRWWTDEGASWLRRTGAQAPHRLRRGGDGWQRRRDGRWAPLDPREPACHLTRHEADAWCRWAGRRLPGELEWERAACTLGDAFRRGDVWEWTASPFEPFPGFRAHPYRDYSAPWFDGRPVLRGGSYLTQPRVAHPRYRNFFPAWRADVPAGFRSCAA